MRVARDWCGSGGNGTVVTEASRRGPLACRTNAYKSLRPGQHSYTSAWHDTDAFGVSGGCRMAVQWNLDGQESGPIKYYAPPRGTNYWVKVSNIYDIDIESYTC
ncbi:hypothetical protein Arub01_27280 [Actinomadura rubrobrunea]|uniref:Uncharacterized protein n=1 Tax=Actinomadura rubrobrunea TaxID=115335 RepID=A0A9W6PU02_9ACTN|nr:hypothetical protein Arub01_27280 [Actinomadura rubrobrunea]